MALLTSLYVTRLKWSHSHPQLQRKLEYCIFNFSACTVDATKAGTLGNGYVCYISPFSLPCFGYFFHFSVFFLISLTVFLKETKLFKRKISHLLLLKFHERINCRLNFRFLIQIDYQLSNFSLKIAILQRKCLHHALRQSVVQYYST